MSFVKSMNRVYGHTAYITRPDLREYASFYYSTSQSKSIITKTSCH